MRPCHACKLLKAKELHMWPHWRAEWLAWNSSTPGKVGRRTTVTTSRIARSPFHKFRAQASAHQDPPLSRRRLWHQNLAASRAVPPEGPHLTRAGGSWLVRYCGCLPAALDAVDEAVRVAEVWRGSRIEPLHLLGAQAELGRLHVGFQLLDAARAEDGRGDLGLAEQPRE